MRFEKRLDPELPPKALARFVEILRETCPELKILSAADVKNFTSKKRILDFSLKNLNQKLGQKVVAEKAAKILTNLGFKVQKNSPENWKVEVPSFRAGRDVESEIDLIEEVVRHLGYADLSVEFPSIQMASPRFSMANKLKKEIEDALVGFGFHETATLAMVSEDLFLRANQKLEKAVKLQNPPSEDYRFLRNSLLASLLEVAAHNAKNENSFRLFEISTVFEGSTEKNRLVALIVGETNSFLKIRGVLEKLLTSLQFSSEISEALEVLTTAHPGRLAAIKIAGKKIGTVAELHPAVVKNFTLSQTAFFEIDFDLLAQVSRSVAKAQDLPKFPGVPRDLAILVGNKTSVRKVENAILTSDPKIQDLKLFDIYEGDKIPADSKSLAFSFTIRDAEKTLEEKESGEILQKIVANLTQIGGKLRS